MPKMFDSSILQSRRFQVSNKADQAEIIIYGSIGASWWDEAAVTAKNFAEELNKIPASVKEIHVRINSGGGDVFEGVTIYERLKQHKARKIVYVDGLAASIASVIAMAGDEIHIGEGAFMMIHRPWCGSLGNSSEHERTINLLDKIEDSMVGIYARKTGLSRTEITKMMSEDYWMNAEESVEKGFATEKTEESDSLHLAAGILAKFPYHNKPDMKAENKVVKNKIAEIKNNIQNFQSRNKA